MMHRMMTLWVIKQQDALSQRFVCYWLVD